jgi:hypothetical protein
LGVFFSGVLVPSLNLDQDKTSETFVISKRLSNVSAEVAAILPSEKRSVEQISNETDSNRLFISWDRVVLDSLNDGKDSFEILFEKLETAKHFPDAHTIHEEIYCQTYFDELLLRFDGSSGEFRLKLRTLVLDILSELSDEQLLNYVNCDILSIDASIELVSRGNLSAIQLLRSAAENLKLPEGKWQNTYSYDINNPGGTFLPQNYLPEDYLAANQYAKILKCRAFVALFAADAKQAIPFICSQLKSEPDIPIDPYIIEALSYLNTPWSDQCVQQILTLVLPSNIIKIAEFMDESSVKNCSELLLSLLDKISSDKDKMRLLLLLQKSSVNIDDHLTSLIKKNVQPQLNEGKNLSKLGRFTHHIMKLINLLTLFRPVSTTDFKNVLLELVDQKFTDSAFLLAKHFPKVALPLFKAILSNPSVDKRFNNEIVNACLVLKNKILMPNMVSLLQPIDNIKSSSFYDSDVSYPGYFSKKSDVEAAENWLHQLDETFLLTRIRKMLKSSSDKVVYRGLGLLKYPRNHQDYKMLFQLFDKNINREKIYLVLFHPKADLVRALKKEVATGNYQWLCLLYRDQANNIMPENLIHYLLSMGRIPKISSEFMKKTNGNLVFRNSVHWKIAMELLQSEESVIIDAILRQLIKSVLHLKYSRLSDIRTKLEDLILDYPEMLSIVDSLLFHQNEEIQCRAALFSSLLQDKNVSNYLLRHNQLFTDVEKRLLFLVLEKNCSKKDLEFILNTFSPFESDFQATNLICKVGGGEVIELYRQRLKQKGREGIDQIIYGICHIHHYDVVNLLYEAYELVKTDVKNKYDNKRFGSDLIQSIARFHTFEARELLLKIALNDKETAQEVYHYLEYFLHETKVLHDFFTSLKMKGILLENTAFNNDLSKNSLKFHLEQLDSFQPYTRRASMFAIRSKFPEQTLALEKMCKEPSMKNRALACEMLVENNLITPLVLKTVKEEYCKSFQPLEKPISGFFARHRRDAYFPLVAKIAPQFFTEKILEYAAQTRNKKMLRRFFSRIANQQEFQSILTETISKLRQEIPEISDWVEQFIPKNSLFSLPKISSDKLVRTRFTTTLNQKIEIGKNLIYYSSPDNKDKEVSFAGINSSASLLRIKSESREEIEIIADLTMGKTSSEIEFSYSDMQFDFKFDTPFELLHEPIKIGINNVAGFGLQGSFSGSRGTSRDKICKQIPIFYYFPKTRFPQNDASFVVKIVSKDQSNEIILAQIERQKTLTASIELAMKIVNERNEPKFLTTMSQLRIPFVEFNLRHVYKVTDGQNLLNSKSSNLPFQYSIQDISFYLNKTGTILRNGTFQYEDFSSPQIIINRPFLLIIKSKTSKKPILVVWIENDELLRKWIY